MKDIVMPGIAGLILPESALVVQAQRMERACHELDAIAPGLVAQATALSGGSQLSFLEAAKMVGDREMRLMRGQGSLGDAIRRMAERGVWMAIYPDLDTAFRKIAETLGIDGKAADA